MTEQKKEQARVLQSKVFGGTYISGEQLGSGAQATVYKFQHRTEDGTITETYACKQTSTTYLTSCPPKKSEARWNSMIRELVILEMLDSPNIIRVYEFIRTKKNFYMIQEFANGGSLQSLLEIKGRFEEATAKKLLKQIITGCSALYALKVMHRDLKLDNILISFPNIKQKVTKEQLKSIDMSTEEFVIKIADLGYSRSLEIGETAMTGCGTPLQMAPEILFSQGYDYKVDVWALGALYYTLLTGMYVFNADSMRQLEQRVQRGDWKWPTAIDFSLQGLEFLKQTFQFNQRDRLNWDQISNHPYLTMKVVDRIPLQILYDKLDGQTSEYEGNYLVINTRDPSKFQKLYTDASARMMKKCEAEIENRINGLVRDSKSPNLNEIMSVERNTNQVQESPVEDAPKKIIYQEQEKLPQQDQSLTTSQTLLQQKNSAKESQLEKAQPKQSGCDGCVIF